MANKEHVQPLIAAVVSMSMAPWNRWRLAHPDIRPDFLGVELPDLDLKFANMSYADFSHANLRRTNFHHANLRHTDLSSTSLQNADLSEADLSYSILKGADLGGAILRNADLRGTDLTGANIKNADFTEAILVNALLDPNTISRQKNRFSRGVSYLEKFVLFFTRAKMKDYSPLDGDTGLPRSGKRISYGA